VADRRAGYAPIFHLIKNGRFLPQGILLPIGKSIPISIILLALVKSTKISPFKPVAHSIAIRILGFQKVMSRQGDGCAHLNRGLHNRPALPIGESFLAHLPISKNISIARQIWEQGGKFIAHFHHLRIGYKTSRLGDLLHLHQLSQDHTWQKYPHR
jgi:hypothetical protein